MAQLGNSSRTTKERCVSAVSACRNRSRVLRIQSRQIVNADFAVRKTVRDLGYRFVYWGAGVN